LLAKLELTTDLIKNQAMSDLSCFELAETWTIADACYPLTLNLPDENARSFLVMKTPFDLEYQFQLHTILETKLPIIEVSDHFRAIVDSSHDAIISKQLDGTILSWNKAAETIFGYRAEEMIGQKVTTIFPTDRLSEEDLILSKLSKGERIEHFRTERIHKSGRVVHVSVTISPILDSTGQVIGASKIAKDITQRVNEERELIRYRAMVESSEDAIISKSLDGTILSWNKAATQLFGYQPDEVIGKHIRLLFPFECYEEEDHIIDMIGRGESIKHYRTTRMTKTGLRISVSVSISPIYDHNHSLVGISKIVRDISHELEEEASIRQQAHFDSLTGLLNRNSLRERLEQHLIACHRQSQKLALLFLDLDNFKYFNDTHGHDFGDNLLVTVSETIREKIRKNDYVGRFGGDEFVIVFDDITDRYDLRMRAHDIVTAINELNIVNAEPVNLSASIGVAVYPDDGDDVPALMKKSDMAMYSAKNQGKNQFKLYSSSPSGNVSEGQYLIQELELAIERNQLELEFQPIVRATGREVVGAEAVLSWQHHEMGSVGAELFLPLAKKQGLLNELGEWVIETALAHLSKWSKLYRPDFSIAMNLTPYLIDNPVLNANGLLAAVKKWGIEPTQLVINVSEQILLENAEMTSVVLGHLRKAGFRTAIDYFASGPTSLTYLQRYPIDFIKLDDSFVMAIESNLSEYQLCDGLISIADKLGLAVIANGVTSTNQIHLLDQLGCHFYQGTAFTEPLSAIRFEKAMIRPSLSQG
jgi:diguanylate cyclase (GGDEF)-like protein/PAS domain S-box-containing protein